MPSPAGFKWTSGGGDGVALFLDICTALVGVCEDAMPANSNLVLPNSNTSQKKNYEYCNDKASKSRLGSNPSCSNAKPSALQIRFHKKIKLRGVEINLSPCTLSYCLRVFSALSRKASLICSSCTNC